MLQLTRTVRFAISDAPHHPTPSPAKQTESDAGWNTFAASPSMRGLGRYYELEVTCRGRADPITGYFINIREIDHAVRCGAVPIIEQACRTSPGTDPIALLPRLLPPIEASLRNAVQRGAEAAASHFTNAGLPPASAVDSAPVVSRIRWKLSPYYCVEMSAPNPSSPAPVALLRQQFEFAASHRLQSASLTDEQNRALFGKCNLPSGHGHNYRVEPCVAVPLPVDAASAPFTLQLLERLTHEHIIRRFDHTHLNVDTKEFGCAPGGLNPSVENIAKVCYDLLAPAVRNSGTGAELRCVTVWETDKTSCTYPA
ncbi:MAG: 6-carboxytetrahydropterin synthase [Gemmatimonadales bacterium]